MELSCFGDVVVGRYRDELYPAKLVSGYNPVCVVSACLYACRFAGVACCLAQHA